MGNNNDGKKDLKTGTESGIVTEGLIQVGSNFDYNKKQYPNMPEANASQFIEKTFIDGDFKAPKEIIQGALNFADEIIEAAKKKNIDLKKSEFAAAAGLDGDDKTLTKQELASYLLAVSVSSSPTVPQFRKEGDVVTTFDNSFSLSEINALQGKKEEWGIDPSIIAALGKQILGDNFDKKLNTDSKEADAEFVKEIDPKIPHARC